MVSSMSDRKSHPTVASDDPAQSQRFIDMAREVEADETPETLYRAIEKIIKSKSISSRKPLPEVA